MSKKQHLATLSYYVGRFVASIISFGLSRNIRKLYHHFYSGKISKYIKNVEDKFYVESPFILHGGEYISIGKNFESRANCRIEAYDYHNGHSFKPELHIGNNVALNFDCHIGCINQIRIGNNVLLASKVFITDHFHGKIDWENLQIPPNMRVLYSKGSVVIEDNVWIGEGAVIMPNVVIGKNSIIGANSVVTKSFPENSTIAGVPAKLIKTYDK